MRALAAALGLALAPAHASDEAARRAAEQRIIYVERLLGDSAAKSRAEAHPAARDAWRAAGAALDRARGALAAGASAQGLAAVDEALQAAMRARRLAPDRAANSALERERYARRFRAAESLVASLEGYARAQRGEGERDLERALRHMAEAERLAAAGRHAEGEALLAQADALLTAALDRLMGGRTLDYTPRFASLEEEIGHERARVRGLRELLPLAFATLNPDPARRTLAERYVAEGEALEAAAQSAARAGDSTAALETLRAAALLLQRALAASGVAYPR